MGFRIKIFEKQSVFLLFSVCSFITLLENMICEDVSEFYTILLSSSATNEFYLKICVSSYFR